MFAWVYQDIVGYDLYNGCCFFFSSLLFDERNDVNDRSAYIFLIHLSKLKYESSENIIFTRMYYTQYPPIYNLIQDNDIGLPKNRVVFGTLYEKLFLSW
jgi:hypothetical protein